VLFTPTYLLVQRLLVAKRDLLLERELQRLDRFDAVILDDIGYVQQDRDEMEVLFTFLAQRYERRSVVAAAAPDPQKSKATVFTMAFSVGARRFELPTP
jgi:DNA replication protein DnaC